MSNKNAGNKKPIMNINTSSTAAAGTTIRQKKQRQLNNYSSCTNYCGDDYAPTNEGKSRSKENDLIALGDATYSSQQKIDQGKASAAMPAKNDHPQTPAVGDVNSSHLVSNECTEWDENFAYMYVNWPTQPLEGLELYQSLCWGRNKNKPKPVQQTTNIIRIGFSLH